MSDALNALYKAISNRLGGANALWGDRVRPEYIPSTDPRPAIVFGLVSGGDNSKLRQRDPSYLIDIKIITASDGQNASRDAMAGAGFITDLVNNQGSQDVDDNNVATSRAMSGDTEWEITTITQGARIHIVDNWSKNGIAVYHSGHEFLVTMEEL